MEIGLLILGILIDRIVQAVIVTMIEDLIDEMIVIAIAVETTMIAQIAIRVQIKAMTAENNKS